MQSGPGVLKDKLGEYVGEFHNNMKHGKGVYTDRISGIVYEGEYFKDEQTGYGVHIYPSGHRYEGYFKNQKKHGKGVFTWKNNDRYDGAWVDDEITGKGIMFYENGYKNFFLIIL